MCYSGVPEEYKEAHIIVEDAKVSKLPTLKYMSVGEVCKGLGGKI